MGKDMSSSSMEPLKVPLMYTMSSAALWYVLYICTKRIWQTEAELTSRIMAALHAVFITILASYVSHIGPNVYYTEPGTPNSYHQEMTIAICLGYFLYDFAWCLYYQADGLMIIIHHILTIISFGSVLIKGCSGTEALAGIISLEITNPLLQTRWFLKHKGHKNTWLFKVVEITFIVTFILCRIVWGTFFTYKIWTHPRPTMDVKAFTMMLYLLSWGFMLHILHYVWVKYIKYGSRPAVQNNNETPSAPPREHVQ